MHLMPIPHELTMLKEATWVENTANWTILKLRAMEDLGTKVVLPLDTATTLPSAFSKRKKTLPSALL